MHKIYLLNWLLLIIGLLFLVIGIWTLFRNVKRDKLIAFSVCGVFFMFYLFTELRINYFQKKIENYFGIHQLKEYNGENNYNLEVLPNNNYIIYNEFDTVRKGTWEAILGREKVLLMLDGSLFGVGALGIK